MTTPHSSSTSSRQRKLPANLALCRTTEDVRGSTATDCLGWQYGNGEAVTTSFAAMTHFSDNLNWRYDEQGFLRSVDRDGLVTDQCLGPVKGITSLERDTREPYELILQDCPGSSSSSSSSSSSHNKSRSSDDESSHQPQENIFSHETLANEEDMPRLENYSSSTAATRTASMARHREEEHQKQPQDEPQDEAKDEAKDELHRHMRFLVGDDGRVRSLAPVYDPSASSPDTDLVMDDPFCVTTEHKKAYLIPCFGEDETYIYESPNQDHELASSEGQIIFGAPQQVFQLDPRTSFDSFLLDWENEITHERIIAHQVGTPHTLDSFAIEVTPQGIDNTKDLEYSFPLVFETTSSSGVASYSLAAFAGFPVDARLLGTSIEIPEPSVLASTSFLVSPDAINGAAANLDESASYRWNWPLPHMIFWGFLISFAICIKAHQFFHPKKHADWKIKLRESAATMDTTAATVASMIRQHQLDQLHQDLDWNGEEDDDADPRYAKNVHHSTMPGHSPVRHHHDRRTSRGSRRNRSMIILDNSNSNSNSNSNNDDSGSLRSYASDRRSLWGSRRHGSMIILDGDDTTTTPTTLDTIDLDASTAGIVDIEAQQQQ